MSFNPFGAAEAWSVSTDDLLPIGNHRCKIESVEDATGKSSPFNPQAIVQLRGANGGIKDWIVYHDEFLSKIVSIYDAAQIERPQVGEFDPDNKFRLTQACLNRLVGKEVGVVVREEEDNRPDHAGEMRRRVKGYVLAADVDADIPSTKPPRQVNANGPAVQQASAAQAVNESIPF
jgi:hypothetical protein